MSEKQTAPEVCPNCGGTHLEHELILTFKGPLLEAAELMAARRKEDVADLIVHLLWLESSKVKAARALMMHEMHNEV